MLLARSPAVVVALALAARVAASGQPDAGCGQPGTVEALAAGARLLEDGQPLQALVPLERAAADPGFLARDVAEGLLAEALLQAGDPVAALRVAEHLASEGGAARPAALRARARALEALGRWDEAAQAWADVQSAPGSQSTLDADVGRAEALEAAGRLAEAARAWRELALAQPALVRADALEHARDLAVRSGRALREPTARELMSRARSLLQAGLHDRAIAAHREAEQAGAGDDAVLGRARAHHAARQDAETEAACVALASSHPSSPLRGPCLVLRARSAWRHDDTPTVLARLDEAQRLPGARAESWGAEALRVRGGVLLEAGRLDEAIAVFDRLAAGFPGTEPGRDGAWKAAWCRILQARHDDAIARLDALASGQDDVALAAHWWAGESARRAGRAEEAAARWEALHRRSPYSYHGRLARSSLGQARPAEALVALDDAVAAAGRPLRDPGQAALADEAGRRYAILRDAGLHGHALAELERHRDRAPDTDALVLELAEARSRAGLAASGYLLVSRRFGSHLEQPSRASTPRLWRVAYPSPHADVLEREAALNAVPVPLAAALVRAESWWTPEARSPAGAVGLMQLMPATARRLASSAGLPQPSEDDLLIPDANLRLGTFYLGRLLERFGGEAAPAVASYNAGEDKVSAWWAEFDALGVDSAAERVERIPYRETRDYVKRVLEAAGWYSWLSGQPGGWEPEDGAIRAGLPAPGP